MSPLTNSAHLPDDWANVVPSFIAQKHLPILKKVNTARKQSTIYPPEEFVFNALALTPFEMVKVVLVGQDPYHGAGQAHGLSFSVPEGLRPPPSLRNIFKEIKAEYPDQTDASTDLTRWAKQGVLLLNTTLTVEEKKPASHAKMGWQTITDDIISTLSEKQTGLVFLLWGAHAQEKTTLIDSNKHLILQTSHPSPFSAHRGFLGCNHFRLTNEWLSKHHKECIKW